MRPRRLSDPILVLAVVLLCGVGAFMVYSASLVVAYSEFQDDTYFLSRQLLWIGLGLTAMFVLSRIDYHRWQRYTVVFLLLGILLLAAVLVPGIGQRSYGASRWLRLSGLLQVQPSEVIKLLMVLYMADWLASKGKRVSEFMASSLPFLVVQAVVCSLVVVEPDLGTTIVIAATSVSIFFLAGANLVHFVGGLTLATAASYLAISRVGYRMDRISAFLDPWNDPQGTGWHTIQTLIALGSGGLLGDGLGAGRQKAGWLVNAHTDAILAIVGEELGLIGTIGVVMLFAILTWRGLRIAHRAPDAFGRLLAAGLTTMLFWQAAINVAVVTNSVPYTGVPLPFISFGGNSTLISLAAVGILLSISRSPGQTRIRHGTAVEAPEPPAPDRARARRQGHGRPAPDPVLASAAADAPLAPATTSAALAFGRQGGAG